MANWWDAPAPDPLGQPAAAGSSLIPAAAAAAPPPTPGLPVSQDNPYLKSALARYQQLRDQARVGLAAPVQAPPPAPAEPPAKPFMDVGNALSAAGTFLRQAPTSAAGALAQLYVGGDRPDTYHPYARSLIDAANQQNQENQARIAQSQRAGTADSVSESLLEASGSSGFSLASMLAGLGGFAAGSAVAGPVAGGATALAASGAAGYRMAEAGLLDEAFKGAESAMQAQQGRRMTDAEKADLYQKILPIAQNTGLWEAGPEAVGNALVAIGGGTALGFLGKDVIKGLATSAAKRAGIRLAAGAAGVGSEVGTEGITQYHQGNDQARVEAVLAGKSPETAERPYQGVAGLGQAIKDVAPQTLALVGMMGLGAKAAHLAYRPMQQRAEAAQAGAQATQHAELAQAALTDLDEAQLHSVVENARQALAGNPKMPATLRAQLHGVIAPLEADLQSRANGEAFRQAMADPEALRTARGQNVVLGMAHPARVAQLSDGEVEAAGRLADELSQRENFDEGQRQAFSQAAQAYRQAATTRRQMQEFDAAIQNDPEVARLLTRSITETVLGSPKEGITPESARAAMDEGELTRHLSAAEGLLTRHADRMDDAQTKALTQAREVLLAEQEHRATQPDWQEQNAAILKNNAPSEVKLRAAFAENPKKMIAGLGADQGPLLESLIGSLDARIQNYAKTGLAAPKELTEPLALLQARKAELEAEPAKSAPPPFAESPPPPFGKGGSERSERGDFAPLPAAPVPSLAEALKATPTGADPLAEFINRAAPGPSLLPPVPQRLPPSPPIPGSLAGALNPAPLRRAAAPTPAVLPGLPQAALGGLNPPGVANPQELNPPGVATPLLQRGVGGDFAPAPAAPPKAVGAQGPIAAPVAPELRPQRTPAEVQAWQGQQPAPASPIFTPTLTASAPQPQPQGTADEKGQTQAAPLLNSESEAPIPPGAGGYLSHEIPAEKSDAHAYRRAAQAIAKTRYASKPPVSVTVQATQESVLVGWNGIKHVLRDGKPTWQESLAALHVEELLQKATKTSVEPDRLGRKDPMAVHRYQTTASFDGVSHSVTLVVREHTDGKRYYDHSIIETKTPAGLPVSPATKTAPNEPAPPFAEVKPTIPPTPQPGKNEPAAGGEPDFTPATAADRSAQARAEALADPDFRAAMDGYARTTGWAEEGGHLILKNPDEAVSRDNIAGRTQWLPNSPWWAASTGARKGFTEAQIQALVQQFQRGEAPRTARETRFLDFLIEDIADEKARNEESAALERELTAEEHDRLDRAEQEARAWLGEDRYEAMLETLAKRYPDLGPAPFNRALLLTLENALERRNADLQSRAASRTGRDVAGAAPATAQSAGAAADEAPLLAAYSKADLAARDEALAQRQAEQAAQDQAAAKKAAADQARSTFVLTGSDRPADVAASRGQGDLLAGAKPTPNKPSAPRQLFAQASRVGQAPGLFEKPPVAVTRLTGQEISGSKSLWTLREAVKAWAQRYRGQSFPNADTRTSLTVGKEGYRHLFGGGKTLPELQAAAALPELIKNAVLADIHADRKGEAQLQEIWRMYAPLEIDGKLYRVKLTVKNRKDGLHQFHEIDALQIENPAVNAHEVVVNSDSTPSHGRPAGHSNISIDRLLHGAKRESDGQPFRPDPERKFARASTPATLTANLKALAGDALVQDLLDNGRLILVARQDQLPASITIPAGERVAGAVDPKTGQVYLVAENIRPGEVQGFLLHEIGVHQAQLRLNQPKPNAVRLAHALLRLVGARQVLGEASFTDVLKQMERLRAIGHVGVRAAFAQAEAAMTALGQNPALLPEEALAYLVQSHPQLSVVQRMIAAVRAFLYQAGFRVNLTENDLRALAVSALKGAARQDSGRRETVTAGARGRNADDAEAQRQYDAVVKRYQGTPQWMKAPNGQPTKLTERQWVQVRTERFKQWFGDWEIAAQPLRQARTFSEAREAVKDFQGKLLTSSDGLTASVSRNNLDKMLSASAAKKSKATAEHAQAVANLDMLFSNAVIGWSKTDRDLDPNIKAVHRLFAPMRAGAEARLVKLTVKELAQSNQGNRVYSVETIEVGDVSPVPEMVDADRATGSRLLTGPTGLIENVVQKIQNFNQFQSSKVVDANGEPLVVYHGSHSPNIEQFLPAGGDSALGEKVLGIFRTAKAKNEKFGYMDFRSGTFFSPDPSYAGHYAEEEEGVIYPVYVVAKNPVYLDGKNVSAPYASERAKTLDALILREGDKINEIAVIDPLQVKSAIGNTGAFSSDQADIRYGLSPEHWNALTDDQKFEYAVAALRMLSGNPDLFQYGKSSAKGMAEIAAELSRELQVTPPNARKDNPLRATHALKQSWEVTMPDGATADVILKKNGRELYIDASGLEKGKSFGSLLYQLVGTYARNNGLIFIGDPNGITAAGKARRLEHLIALALKFGTTDFLLPHPDQNIPWKIDQHGYNLAQMIRRSHDLIYQAIPKLKGIRYDFGQRRFIDDRQRPFTEDLFRELAQSAGARAAQAGSATLKRSVLVDSLVQGAGREGWRSILGELARQSGPLGLDPQLKRIYYAQALAQSAPHLTADQLLSRIEAGDAVTPEQWQQVQAYLRASAQPARTGQTLQDWFGASKIKNQQGQPLTMYHGTAAHFNTFSAQKAGESTTHPTAALGFFFTNNRAHAAEKYAGAGGQVLEVYLAVEKPYPMTDAELRAIDGPQDAIAFRQRLEAQGYDGVILPREAGKTVYVAVFRPDQIKRTSNETFTRGEADMRFATPGQESSPPVADAAEAQRQYDAVAARYTLPDGRKAPGWLKAPNGEPTMLTERQWVQVRTERFKQWFGDWEYAAHQQAIDALKTQTADWNAGTTDPALAHGLALAEAGVRWLNDASGNPVERKFQVAENGDEIWISKTGLKKSISKYAGVQKMRMLPILPQLIEQSHFVTEASDNKGRDSIAGYRYYVAKTELDGKPYYVKLAVRDLVDGKGRKRKFYNHDLSEVSEEAGNEPGHSDERSNSPATSSLDHIVRHGWQKFNGKVSPAVDANGEPRFAATESAQRFARAYSTELEAALDKIGKRPPQSWRARFAGLTDRIGLKLRQAVADHHAALLDLDRQAYGHDVVENDTAAASWVKARLARSVDGPMNLLLHEAALKMDADGALDVIPGSKGLQQILEPLGSEADDFLKWVAGGRADRLQQEDRERLFTAADIAALKTLNQGEMADGRKRSSVYGQALREFAALQKSVMDIAEQAGLIDGAERSAWERDFYVPFYRLAEDTQDARAINAGDGLARQEAFKKLKGGTERLNDLLENTVMNWHHLLSASLKNSAARQALQNAQRVRYDGQPVAEPIDPKRESTKGAVYYREQGRAQWFRVNDPLVLEAITALDFTGIKGPVMDLLRKARHLLTRTTTISPTFKVANLLRDTVQTLAVSQAQVLAFDKAPRFRNVIPGLGNIVQGWKNYAADSALRQSLLAGGGAFRFGSTLEDNANALRKLLTKGVRPETILDTPQKLWDVLSRAYWQWEALGDRLENVNRAALYTQLREKGKSHLYASFQARDLLDFSSSGASGAVRFLTAVVPFLNARIQGLDKLGRAASQPASRGRFAVTLAATTLASALLYLLFKDDKEFKEREEWDRDTYWWFKLGGIPFRIPKPFELGALATLLGDRVMEQLFDKEANAHLYLNRVKYTLTQTFSISGPQLLMPVLNVYANKDPHTGRNIETLAQQRLSPELRQTARTSDTARGISTATGGFVSPVQADYLVGAYFGWLGRQAVLLADYATRPLTDRPSPDRVPVISDLIQRFVPTEQGGSSKYLTRFYEAAKSSEQHYADLRELLKRGDEVGARVLATRYREELGRLKAYRAVSAQLNDWSHQLRIVADLPASKISEAQRTLARDTLQAKKLRLARGLMEGQEAP